MSRDDFARGRIDSSEVMDMRSKKSIMMGSFAALSMLILILDAPTALAGAREGIDLCIRTVVPSLFPFFIISIMLTGSMTGVRSILLSPIEQLCRIPSGCGSLFLIGLLGGYPVGAKCVAESYRKGCIARADARRMLGFCSNAGPAFMFGMVSQQFPRLWMIWALWFILIISAVLTAILLPGKPEEKSEGETATSLTISQVLDQSIQTMARVCGWVIIFRVLLSFLDRWFLWFLQPSMRAAVSGFLELSNGCCELNQIVNPGLRFMIGAAILSFGGICVSMQTISVTGELGTGLYFPGKLLQTVLSVLLAAVIQYITFPPAERLPLSPLFLLIPSVLFVIFKIAVAFPRRMMYNPGKS